MKPYKTHRKPSNSTKPFSPFLPCAFSEALARHWFAAIASAAQVRGIFFSKRQKVGPFESESFWVFLALLKKASWGKMCELLFVYNELFEQALDLGLMIYFLFKKHNPNFGVFFGYLKCHNQKLNRPLEGAGIAPFTKA